MRQTGLDDSLCVIKLAHADQQFDQVKANVIVLGVGLQGFEQFGLSGFQVARFHEGFGLLHLGFGQDFVFARHVFVKKLTQFAFGHGAHETVYRLTVFKHNAGWNAANAKGCGQLLLLVRVNFDQLEAATIGDFHLF